MGPALECMNLELAEIDSPTISNINFALEFGQGGLILTDPAWRGRMLLRFCATSIMPETGKVRWFGRTPRQYSDTGLAGIRRRVGWVHRRSSLVSNMSIIANITIGMIYHRNIKAGQALEEVTPLLELFDLYRHRNKRPADLSFARQKLALYVRELAKNPALIILEEPAVDLNQDFEVLMGEIRRRVDEGRTSLLIADHALDEVLDCVDWVLVMDDDGHRTWAVDQFDVDKHVPFPTGRGVIRNG